MNDVREFFISWKFTNFRMCPFKPNDTLLSPVVAIGVIGGTKWRLVLHLKNQQFPNHIGFFLKRESCDSGIDSITVDLTFHIYNGSDTDFQNVKRKLRNRTFVVGAVEGCEDILGYNEYPTKHEDETSFCCYIIPSQVMTERIKFEDKITFNHHFGDFQRLSEGLGNLIPSVTNDLSDSEYVEDLILDCRGQIFKVHKCILAARCPTFLNACEKKENRATASELAKAKTVEDMSTSCLKSILWYVYTGELRIQTSEIPTELYKVAVKYGMADFIQLMEDVPLYCNFQTKFRVETHNIEWFVDKTKKFRELARVVRTETMYIRGLIVMLDIRRSSKARDEYFILTICLQGFKELKPVFVSVNTYIKIHTNTCEFKNRMAFSGRHLFETDECWRRDFGPPDGNPHIPSKFVFLCDIEICDGEQLHTSVEFEVIETTRKIETPHRRDYFKLSRDMIQLRSSETFADVKIDVPGRLFRAHKVILGARSSVFRSMFSSGMLEHQKGEVKIENICPETMEQLLTYLYSGTLKNLDFAVAACLYKAADYYDLTHLKKICTDFMLSEYYLEDLAIPYQLAHIFNDVEMQKRIAAIGQANNITEETLSRKALLFPLQT